MYGKVEYCSMERKHKKSSLLIEPIILYFVYKMGIAVNRIYFNINRMNIVDQIFCQVELARLYNNLKL